MFKSFTSRTLLKSTLALHVSLLTACSGNTPLPLFSGTTPSGTTPETGNRGTSPAGSATERKNADFSDSVQTSRQTSGQSSSDAASCNPCGSDSTTSAQQMPVFTVVGHGLSQGQASQLASAFKLRELKLEADGSVSYLDGERFQNIPVKSSATEFKTQATTTVFQSPTMASNVNPKLSESLVKIDPRPKPEASPEETDFSNEDREKTVAQYLDLEALKALKIQPDSVALDQVLMVLNRVGLMPEGKPIVGHSEFEARSAEGSELAQVQLDTQVGFEQNLGQLKLMGPGAKVKVVVDGEGVITQLRYASRQLKQGESVGIIDAPEAEKQALELLNQQADSSGKWEVSTELIYYAPPLSQRVQTIYPHYLVKGSLRSANGQEVQGRMLVLPAVQNGLKIRLGLKQDGSQMEAEARVTGGTAPYSYSWSSAHSQIDASNQSSLRYSLSQRQKSQEETLYLTVTDANGLSSSTHLTQAIDASQVKSFETSVFRTMSPGRFDAGTEWVGLSQGLGGSRDNANGFVKGFRDRGQYVSFNFGDYAAWEEDFKKSSMGGTDDSYADNVDMAFYTGHANGNYFSFPGTRDDGALEYTDASYGERDLEWLMIAACGPMQRMESGMHLFDRWGRAFKGLHLLAGYATVSFDNTIEGDRLARNLLSYGHTVRQAWAQMATEAQPDSVTYGYMGVIGPSGLMNSNDHYWGKGTVGPDIHDVRGYWSVHAPS
jgi:hypothetical protein